MCVETERQVEGETHQTDKNEVKIKDVSNHSTWKQYEIKNLLPHCVRDEIHLNQEITNQLPFINTYKVVFKGPIFPGMTTL